MASSLGSAPSFDCASFTIARPRVSTGICTERTEAQRTKKYPTSGKNNQDEKTTDLLFTPLFMAAKT